MNKEEYKRLNIYLNKAFQILEINDRFLLDNIENLDILFSDILYFNQNINIKSTKIVNYLTFLDVYEKAFSIIKKINPAYLNRYEKILDNGTLDFSYNNFYEDSYYEYDFKTKIEQININRTFNYTDVVLLIHEFFHLLNSNTNKNLKNNYLLTEFVSIYFELIAIKQLILEGFVDEVDYSSRLENTYFHMKHFLDYSPILLSFREFGCVDDDSYKLINKYFYEMSQKEFLIKTKKILSFLDKKYEQYKKNTKFNSFYSDNIYLILSDCFNSNYRYIIGSICAFYALYNCDIKDIILLNDNLKNEQLDNYSLIELLSMLKINIQDNNFVYDVTNSVNNYVNFVEKRKEKKIW